MKSLFSTKLIETSTSDEEGVGTLRFEDDKVYRWVQNYHTAALEEGNVAFHVFSHLGNAHKRVTWGLTANLGYMAGVVMSQASVAAASTITAGDGGYCWVQVLGYNATAAVFASETDPKTVGDTLIGVNLQLYAHAGAAMGTAPKYTKNLLLLEAVATATTEAAEAHDVYVHCL
jgi:hypothetical protein